MGDPNIWPGNLRKWFVCEHCKHVWDEQNAPPTEVPLKCQRCGRTVCTDVFKDIAKAKCLKLDDGRR